MHKSPQARRFFTYNLASTRRTTRNDFVLPFDLLCLLIREKATHEIVDGKFDGLLRRNALSYKNKLSTQGSRK